MERLLQPLRDDPLPPSSVDVGRALADGRRRVRHRRYATVAAACCAVLALVGGVAVAASRPTGGAEVGCGPSGSQTRVMPAPMPAEAPAILDPTRRYAAFGWLPDGLTDVTVSTEPHQFMLIASAPETAGAEDRPSVELRLVSSDHDIALTPTDSFAVNPGVTAGWAEVGPAEPVHGRTARWNGKAADAGADAALRWEYAPNAWAEVTVRGGAACADAKATARRVAESVRYGVNEPIRLPLRITGLPAVLQPMSISLSVRTGDASGWTVRMAWGTGGRTAYGDWPLTVTVLPRTSSTGDGGGVIADPDTTLDGHPARRSRMADGGEGLQVYGVQGCYLEFATHDAATTRQLPGGLDGFFRGMTLYPDPRDWK